MTLYIIAAVLIVVALIVYRVFLPKSSSTKSGYFISTQSESNERVKSLQLDKRSEDVSYILDTSRLTFPHMPPKPDTVEYKADPEREWVIDLIQVNGDNFKKNDFNKIFNYEWRTKFPSSLYGFSPIDKRWTFADAGGTPDIYSKLQVAVDVQEIYSDKNMTYDPKELEKYIIELEKRLKKYPAKLRIEPHESIDSAIIKAKRLIALHKEFNHDAIIVLKSNNEYKGIEMWDALQCIGLTWGDGDLFHWNNNKEYGHDQHFSVWTVTEPGYFLPEAIKAGEMNPVNLVFGFSIPRSADAKNIYDIMLNAARYCQKRLGGQLLNKAGNPLDEQKEKHDLADLLKKMETAGIIAGSDKALRMF